VRVRARKSESESEGDHNLAISDANVLEEKVYAARIAAYI
jgi:hypothetical protein